MKKVLFDNCPYDNKVAVRIVISSISCVFQSQTKLPILSAIFLMCLSLIQAKSSQRKYGERIQTMHPHKDESVCLLVKLMISPKGQPFEPSISSGHWKCVA